MCFCDKHGHVPQVSTSHRYVLCQTKCHRIQPYLPKTEQTRAIAQPSKQSGAYFLSQCISLNISAVHYEYTPAVILLSLLSDR